MTLPDDGVEPAGRRLGATGTATSPLGLGIVLGSSGTALVG